MSGIRVVLADDHPITRAGIKKYLSNSIEVQIVGEASDGEEAIKLVEELKPDVLVLDIEMPVMKGLDVLKKLKSDGSGVNILALSTYDEKDFIFGMLAAGACGYLTKEELPENILKAVLGVGRGERGWVSRKVAAIMSVWTQGSENNNGLTERETQVLRLVVDGKTNQEIGYILRISQKTVEKHMESVFAKLNVHSRVEAAVLAVKDDLV